MGKVTVNKALGLLVLSLAAMLAATAAAPSSSSSTFAPRKAAPSAQTSLAGLEPLALRRWPESFGGLWLGRGRKVFIALTERPKERVRRLDKLLSKARKLRAVKVDDSLAALRRLQAQMIADRETNPPAVSQPATGQPGIQPAPPQSAPLTQYDLNIDVKRNLVVVIVERQVTPELAGVFSQRYGDDVVVERGILSRPAACSRQSCAPLLRGGLVTWAPTTGCSTAFNGYVEDPGGPAADVVLSAAHCGIPDADVGGPRSHGGAPYGEVIAEQQSDRLDAEVHSVHLGAFDASKPWMYLSGLVQQAPISSVGTYGGLPIGTKVCKSGTVTGVTCGKVLSKYLSPWWVDHSKDFIEASFCIEHGDSGGSVYQPVPKKPKKRKKKGKKNEPNEEGLGVAYRAVGVVSGGMALDCGTPGDVAFFGHIDFITDVFPIVIRTAAN